MKCTLCPLPFHINLVALQRCFSYHCCFPERDNPSLVTCSLSKCAFTNSQLRLYSASACRHSCMFYQRPSNLTHSTSSERQWHCPGAGMGEGVWQSAPWRGTRCSAPFWPQLGVSREGWLSSPLSLCSIQAM